MATIVTANGTEEWADTDPRVMAYNALYVAAERMAKGYYQQELAAHIARGRKRSTFK